MNKKGFLLITNDYEKVSKKPGFIRLHPHTYWVPVEGDLSKLDHLQWAVGGHIDIVAYREDILSLWINDEGKINGSKPSERYPADYSPDGEDILFGDLCITGPVDREGESEFITLQTAKNIVNSVPWRVRTAAVSTTKHYTTCGVDAGCIALIKSDLVDDNRYDIKPLLKLEKGTYTVFLTTECYRGKLLKQVELNVTDSEQYYVADPCYLMKYDTVSKLSGKTNCLSEDLPGFYPMNTGGDGEFDVVVYVCEGKL
jgi:hypothetical protein